MKDRYLFFCFAVAVFSCISVNAQTGLTDSSALINFYNSTNGPNWANKTNWFKGPIATWYGVSVNSAGKVTAIRLSNNKLSGSIPNSIGYLDSLTTLALDGNDLKGSLPTSIKNLKNSLNIYLQNNYFNFDALEVVAGYFKSAVYAPQRTVIPVVLTYYTGYGTFTATAGGGKGFGLTYTWYRDSQLAYKATGQYSSYMYQPTIGGNYYVAVTDSAAKGVTLYSGVSRFYSKHEMDSLTLVDLYNSTNGPGWAHKDGWLKAPLNQWYGITLNENGLVYKINLQNNNLVGKIPSSIGDLTEVWTFALDSNKLSGNIPGELYNCSGITSLSLSHNLLTGQIPHLMNGLYNLVSLNVSYNQLSGVLDSAQINNYWLTGLDISHNNFSGRIPDIFTQHNPFTGLMSVNLSYNKFSGELPATTYFAFRMYMFDVSYNNLTGPIPKFQSFHLGYLNLSHNKFTGIIPTEYHYLSGMRTFLINNNNLSGTIPPLTVFQYLEKMDISNNRFTFNGMEALAQQYSKAVYWPQHSLPLGYNKKHFYVHAGGVLKNNTYKWYKNNVLVSTKTGDSTFIPTTKGKYFVTITNTLAPKLTLYTDTLGLTDSLTLPIELTSLTGEMIHGAALLNWQTATEINTAYFNVERSLNGVHFTIVGTVNAAGNSTIVKNYNFTDTNSGQESILYYRLTEVDKDGKQWISHIIKLGANAAQTAPVIWPNPVTNVLTLKWAAAPAPATYVITNIEGKQLLMQQQTAGVQQVQLNTQQLAAGTYILTILTAEGQKQSLKFVKQ